MRISKITSFGLDRLPDVQLDWTHPKTGDPADIVLVSGAMATGKTTLLETVFAAREAAVIGAPAAPWSPSGRDGGPVKIIIDWSLDSALLSQFPGEPNRELEAIVGGDDGFPSENDPVFDYAFADESRSWGRLEYFHARRRGARLDGYASRTHRSSNSVDKYVGTAGFLAQLMVTGDARVTELNETLRAAGSTVQLTGVTALGRDFVPELDGMRTVDDLSDGERDILLVMATAFRFDLGDAPIFLDAPDLALTTDNASRLLMALRDLTGAQLICATSTPAAYRNLGNVIEVYPGRNGQGGLS